MMAALNVLRVVGAAADSDFVAMEILPILWSMSLGPLLNLSQFRSFQELIKLLSRRVEDEQTKKLQELGAGGAPNGGGSSTNLQEDIMSFGPIGGFGAETANGAGDDDFEKLVKGRSATARDGNPMDSAWDAPAPVMGASAATKVLSPGGPRASTQQTPTFSWSTPSPTTAQPLASPGLGSFGVSGARQQQSSFRTVTPDLTSYPSMAPQSTQFSVPLQPTPLGGSVSTASNTAASSSMTASAFPSATSPGLNSSTSINWGAAAAAPNPWATTTANPVSSTPNYSAARTTPTPSLSAFGATPAQATSGFSLPPPPTSRSTSAFGSSGVSSGFSLPPPPPGGSTAVTSSLGNLSLGGFKPPQQQPQQQQQQQGSGLDKYQSLI